ncbi:MAG: hypothetical protein ACPG7F_19165 [Aggregatilineales bacterium]
MTLKKITKNKSENTGKHLNAGLIVRVDVRAGRQPMAQSVRDAIIQQRDAINDQIII